jgi:sigma-B regulation protein RsbQ
MVFAHGFGCDQHMWRFVEPVFAGSHPTVLFDHVGAGGSDLSAFDPGKYASLEGYASDVLEICETLDLEDVIFVGHSVSAMIGVLAAAARPALFERLILVGPSPRYVDDDGYEGGFTREDIDSLLESLDSNFRGWAGAMAPVIMGNADLPDLGTRRRPSTPVGSAFSPSWRRRFRTAASRSDSHDGTRRETDPVHRWTGRAALESHQHRP